MKKNDLTLVIMAAGMGSRFGVLKQIEPGGPNNEFLIDYSIYDAIKCGFSKVVFVIKEENYDIFKSTIGKRLEDKIKVCYAFQKMDDLPIGYDIPKERVKPLGTAQAIYAARSFVDGDFVVINSDDFYGREAYLEAYNFFLNNKIDYCNIAYKVGNTMTLNGSVKRGVIYEEDGYLMNLIESKIEKQDDKIKATPLDGRESFIIDEETLVSMNMLGFRKNIFEYIEKEFPKFLDSHKEDILTCEFLIPDVLYKAKEEGFASVKVIKTDAKWHGVTYKEDKIDVVNSIKQMIKDGIYPDKLWS